uniref:AB hydrolase-1 domain-containing protein n=1 Tax=Parascaris equorum TaxID=6256 RepID=A0A914RUF0_PAREQ
YRDAGSVTRVWSVDRWLEDVLKEIDHSDRPVILLGNSAGCHCITLNISYKREMVIALILLSPGVGLSFQNYASTVFPHSISDLLAGKNILHPVALGGVPALVNLQLFTLRDILFSDRTVHDLTVHVMNRPQFVLRSMCS